MEEIGVFGVYWDYAERLKDEWRNEREIKVERGSEKEAYQNDGQTVNMKIEKKHLT